MLPETVRRFSAFQPDELQKFTRIPQTAAVNAQQTESAVTAQRTNYTFGPLPSTLAAHSHLAEPGHAHQAAVVEPSLVTRESGTPTVTEPEQKHMPSGLNDTVRDKTSAEERKQKRRQKLQRVMRKLVAMNKMRQSHPSQSSIASTATKLISRSPSARRRTWISPGGGARSMDAYIKEQSNIYSYNEQRMAKESELPWHIMNPEAPSKIAWDVVILLLVMFYGFMVPYRIGFQLEGNYSEQVFDDAANVLFMLDIIFSFRTAFKEDGILIRDPKRIAASYAQSWLFVDLIASVPLDWFVNTGGGINKLLRTLRLFKLFRLLRLLKLFPRLFQVLETNIKFNPSMIRFLRSFIVMLLMWHCIACSYWWVARVEYGGYYTCSTNPDIICWVNRCVCAAAPFDPNEVHEILVDIPDEDYDPAWANDLPTDDWVPDVYSANRPESYKYANALFWAVEVTTGIGGDINPKSQIEVAFTTVVTIVGLMMYSLIIGSASSALANMDSTATQRRQTLDKVSAYMRSRKVPAFFQRIIVDFYQHMWTTPMKESDVFKDLPESLRSRLSMVLNRDLIDRIPVFRNMTAEVYIRLVQKLYHNTYLPGEFVIRRGDIPRCVYFVKRGMADGILLSGQVMDTYQPGDFFGEHAVLSNERRAINVRAVDFLDVLQLQKEHLLELRAVAPDFLREIRRVDAERQQLQIQLELQQVRIKHGLEKPKTGTSVLRRTLARIGSPGCTSNSAVEPERAMEAAHQPSWGSPRTSTQETALKIVHSSSQGGQGMLHGGEGVGGIQATQALSLRRASSFGSMSTRSQLGAPNMSTRQGLIVSKGRAASARFSVSAHPATNTPPHTLPSSSTAGSNQSILGDRR